MQRSKKKKSEGAFCLILHAEALGLAETFGRDLCWLTPAVEVSNSRNWVDTLAACARLGW